MRPSHAGTPVGTRSVPLLVVAVLAAGGAAAPAQAQSRDGFPPADSGCGPDGPTRSAEAPSVTLTSTVLRLRATGRVRIAIRGTQTAAATVSIVQRGGRRVGGTAPRTYTCTGPEPSFIAPDLNDYGRTLVRRNGRLRVTVRFNLINRSGVTATRIVSGVIRPA